MQVIHLGPHGPRAVISARPSKHSTRPRLQAGRCVCAGGKPQGPKHEKMLQATDAGLRGTSRDFAGLRRTSRDFAGLRGTRKTQGKIFFLLHAMGVGSGEVAVS